MIDKIRLLTTVMRDKRTPWYAKAIVLLTLAYIVSPIDLIPDFIPVIGLLDEVILIPVMYKLVMKLVPEEVKTEATSITVDDNINSYKVIGFSIVLSIWIILGYLIYILVN